jgi:hypothetical protein
MYAALLIRLGSEVMHSILGGMAIFCLWYAAQASDFHLVCYLFVDALKWGGCATAIVYFKGKYLET